VKRVLLLVLLLSFQAALADDCSGWKEAYSIVKLKHESGISSDNPVSETLIKKEYNNCIISENLDNLAVESQRRFTAIKHMLDQMNIEIEALKTHKQNNK
jgi:hypothetical protein